MPKPKLKPDIIRILYIPYYIILPVYSVVYLLVSAVKYGFTKPNHRSAKRAKFQNRYMGGD